MTVSNYKVHKLWVKEAEFEVLVLEIPEIEIEDKLAYFARDKGNINRSFYEDFVIATCVANINQLLFHIKQQVLLHPNLMSIRSEIMNGIIEINPLFKPDNLVINRNSVVKLKGKKGPKDGERLLIENKSWDLSYYEEVMKNQPQLEAPPCSIDPAQPVAPVNNEAPKKPAGIKPLNELEYVIVKKWWKRINRYVEIKQFKEEDIGSILKQRFFHNRSSFQTFIVSVCVIDSDDLLTLLDNMGIPSRVAPPILMHEIYELCREDNKFLTYENAQKLTEGLENDEGDQPQADVNRNTPNRMASHARQQNTKKKKPKKAFKDVPKEDLLKLSDNMKVFLIGQDRAVNDIAEAVQRASVGLKDPARPIGSFMFAGRTGIGKCTEKGTLIFSEDGIKPIDSFCSGDKISELSMDVYGINGVNRTSHIYKEGIKPGRRIVTDSGYELGGSLIHPVVSLNGSGYPEFKRFFDLTTDDYVAIQYNQNYFSATNKKTNFDFVKRVHDSRSIIHKLPEEINEDLAYYIGLLIGDGGLTIDGMLSFTNKDKQLVRKFFELSKSLFGVIPKYTSGKYGYAIYSTQIYNFLKDGCGITMCKSTHKEIPSIILESTKECIKSFIVGLMDTDGYFEKQGGIVGITLTTKNLVKQLQTVLLNFGIISSVRHKLVRYNGDFNNAWELTIRGKYAKRFFVKIGFSLNSKKDKYNLIYLKNDNPNKDVIPNIHNIIYDLVSAYRLNRKFHRNYRGYYKGYKKPSRKKLIEILNVMHSLVGKEIESNNSYLYLCSLSLKEIFWSKIARIDYVDEMDLYDFTVPKTHTFTSNGFISHNTLAAKVLADELIRDRDNLITIDCSEYSADHEYAKLIGCFVPGTKVLMEDGSRKKIENINVGDKVITHKGRSRKVEFVHEYSQDGEMLEMTTFNSDLPETMTKTHEILAIKRSTCGTKQFEDCNLEWIPAKDLVVGDIVVYPMYKSTDKHSKLEDRYIYKQIKKINIINYTGNVYDLAVEEDMSYVLDFVVHNSPNGYVGFEQGGFLTNAVMKSPFSVVVFDEVEKASTKVHELLLQILEEGRLTDGKGQQVSFKDTIVIMTSNVGVREVDDIKKTIGFGDVAKITDDKKDKAIEEAIKGKFKPEFINRIDAIIKFRGLSSEDYMRIIDIELYKLNDNLKNNDTEYKGLTLKFDNKIKKLIFDLGINEDFGARPLKRCIEKEVATPIAMKLLKENIALDSIVSVSARSKKAVFKINKKPDALFVSDTHKEMATLNSELQ